MESNSYLYKKFNKEILIYIYIHIYTITQLIVKPIVYDLYTYMYKLILYHKPTHTFQLTLIILLSFIYPYVPCCNSCFVSFIMSVWNIFHDFVVCILTVCV